MTNIDCVPNGALILDPNDPFEAALIPMLQTNRAKRRDYAVDGDPFSNFAATAEGLGLTGFGARESALFNVLQKVARLKALRENGRMDETANEAVEDTYLDLAVYSVILLAIVRQEQARLADLEARKAAEAQHFRNMQDGINTAALQASERAAAMPSIRFNGESVPTGTVNTTDFAASVTRNIEQMRRSYVRGID